MDIREFVEEYGTNEAEWVFEKAGSTRAYMTQIKTGQRQVGPKLLPRLIKASKHPRFNRGHLTRESLRPDFFA